MICVCIYNFLRRWKILLEDAVIYHGLLSAIKQTNHLTICDAAFFDGAVDMRLHNNHIFSLLPLAMIHFTLCLLS